jgi:hypothetical protein
MFATQEFVNDFEKELYRSWSERHGVQSFKNDSVAHRPLLSGIKYKDAFVWLKRTLPYEEKYPLNYDNALFTSGRLIYALETGKQHFVDAITERQEMQFSENGTFDFSPWLAQNTLLQIGSFTINERNHTLKITLRFTNNGSELSYEIPRYAALAGDRFHLPQLDEDIKAEGTQKKVERFNTDVNPSFSFFRSYPFYSEEQNELPHLFYKSHYREKTTRSEKEFLALWRTENQSLSKIINQFDTLHVKLLLRPRIQKKLIEQNELASFFSRLIKDKFVYAYLTKDEHMIALLVKTKGYGIYHLAFLKYLAPKVYQLELIPNIKEDRVTAEEVKFQ